MEFTLVIPIFLLLVSGMIDLGVGLNSYMTVISATRDGARAGANLCGTATPPCARSSRAGSRRRRRPTGSPGSRIYGPACTTPGGGCDLL